MSIHFSPFGNGPLILPNGQVAAGYLLYVYEAGGATKATIHRDIVGSAQHTNPIVLGVDGWPPNSLYLDSAKNYRFVYAHPLDADPPTMQLTPPVDNVAVVVSDTQVLPAEWTNGPTPTFISGTQFSLVGDQTAIFHVGRRVRTNNASGFVYGVITASVFSSVTTITVQNDSGAIDSGLSAVAYSFLGANNASWPAGKNAGLTTEFSGPVTIPVDANFNLIPTSLLATFAGTAAPPPGYFLCNGAAISRATYAKLFQAIGTVYGSGDGITTFNVPNIADLQANVKYIIRYA